MDLASLSFVVETKQLENAVNLVDKLGQATQELSKDVSALAQADKNASAAALLSAKARKENAQAAKLEQANVEQSTRASEKKAKVDKQVAESATQVGNTLSAVDKVIEKHRAKVEILASGGIKLNESFVELAQGLTGSQAAQLAQIKLLGATEDQMRALTASFQEYARISGQNPFDASTNGLSRLNKEVSELKRLNDLATNGLGLTRDELKLLSRDIEALRINYTAAGKSTDELAQAEKRLTTEFVNQSKVRNTLLAQAKEMENAQLSEAKAAADRARMEKQSGQELFNMFQLRQKEKQAAYSTDMQELRKFYQEQERASKASGTSGGSTAVMDSQVQAYYKQQSRAANEAAKAVSFVERELLRAEKALEGLNQEMQVSSSNRLTKFEQQLRSSGLEVEQQIRMLERYKNVIQETDKKRQATAQRQQRAEGDRQVELLARSLAPQISDVAVSLAGGMNPFTVLMQQGLQVRDLMQLSGVESERMGEAFRKAGAGMVETSVAAGKAISSMIGGALLDLGSTITGTISKMLGLDAALASMQARLTVMANSSNTAASAVGRFGLAFANITPAATGLAIGALAVGLAAVAAGIVSVLREESKLSKALALTGASLGLSKDQAISLADSYEKIGISQSKALEVFTAVAQSGSINKDVLQQVTDAAIGLERVGGPAIEETVKRFSALGKDPVDGLISLTKEQGILTEAQIRSVDSLVRQGKTLEATTLAQQLMAQSIQETTGIIEAEMGQHEKLWLDIKSGIKSVVEEVKEIARNSGIITAFRTAWETVAVIVAEVWYVIKQTGNEIGGIAAQLAAVLRGDFKGAGAIRDAMVSDAKAARAAQDALIAKILDRGKAEVKVSAETRQANSEAAASLKKRLDDEEAGRKKLAKAGESEAKQLQKYFDSVMKGFKTNADEAALAEENLTKSQKKILEVINDPRFAKFSEMRKIAIMQAYAEAYAVEELAKALEEENKKRATAVELRNKQVEAWGKEMENLQKTLNSSKEEATMLEYEASLVGVVSEERSRLIQIKKAEIELEKELQRIKALDLTKEQKSDLENLARSNYDQKIKNINTKVANDLNQKMVDGVTDAIMTGLIEGGEAGKKKLRDLIVAELQKPVRMVIQAFVSDIFGLNGQGGAGGGMGGSITNSFIGKAMDSALSSYFGTGTTFAGMSSAFSTGIQAGFTGTNLAPAIEAYNTAGMSQYGTALQYGQYAAPVAGVVGGVMAGRAISGGYSAAGKSGNAAVNTGTAIGAAVGSIIPVIGTALGAFIGGALGGVFNRAFGRKLKEEGLRAIMTSGAISEVQNYKFEKGGWFKSDKTTTSAADSATAKQVKEDAEQIKMQALGMANALGLNAAAVQNYSGELKINLKGVKSAEEASQRYGEAMQNLYVDMLKSTGGLDQFRRSGETVEIALQRLTQEATALAQAAGYSAESITQTLVAGMTGRMSEADVGIALADQIIGSIYNALAMGFAEQITGAITGLIIQPIMTAIMTGGSISAAVSQASIQAVVAQAQAAINAFNQIISDPAFQSLIGQIGAMTSQIAKISVKPAANIRKFGSAAVSAGNAAAEAAKKIADERYSLEGKLLEMLNQTARIRQRELNALHASNRGLQMHIYALEDAKKQYDDVVDAANEALDKGREAQQKIKDIFDLLIENIRELRNEVEDTATMQRDQAKALIQNAIGSGVLPNQEDLSKAIESIREGIVVENFATQADANRERLQFAATLEQLSKIAKSDIDQKEQDIILLEQQLKAAQDQINVMLGIQTHTYNTQQAVIALQGALAGYVSAFNNGLAAVANAATSAPAAVASGGGGGGGGWSGGGSSSSSAPKKAWTAQGYWDKNPDLQQYWAANGALLAKGRGWGRDDYLSWHWSNHGQQEKRAYAKGGYYPGGMALVGEEGPELINFKSPGQVYTASQTNNLLGGNSSGIEQKLEQLQATMIVQMTAINKMQRQLNNARGEDGTSLNVTIVNTQPISVDTTP